MPLSQNEPARLRASDSRYGQTVLVTRVLTCHPPTLTTLAVAVPLPRMPTAATLALGSDNLRGRQTIDNLSGPPKTLLFGNALQLPESGFHKVVEGWSEEYGDPHVFYLGSLRVLAIGEPAMVRTTLQQRPKRFRRMQRVEETFSELGFNGVFSAEGDNWKRQRRLIMPSFREQQVNSLYPTLARIARVLLQRCEEAAKTGKPVDILQLMTQFTVDVTTEISFGYPLNTLSGKNGELQKNLARLFPGLVHRILSAIPHWRWLRLPQDRALDRSSRYLRKTVGEIVQATRQQIANNPTLAKSPNNVLQSLLTTPRGA